MIAEVFDYYLWHEIVIPSGDYIGTKNFFNDHSTVTSTNVIGGKLDCEEFIMNRISLMASFTSQISDIHLLLSNSYFTFGIKNKDYYTGPAQIFYKPNLEDNFFVTLKGLPKKFQKGMLENIKALSGMTLSEPFSIYNNTPFFGRFTTPEVVSLNCDVKLTCLLNGKIIRNLT